MNSVNIMIIKITKIELINDHFQDRLAIASDFIMKFVVPIYGIISVQSFVQGYTDFITRGLFRDRLMTYSE